MLGSAKTNLPLLTYFDQLSEISQPLCSCLAHVRCQNGKATTLEFAISLLIRGISLVTWKLGKGSKNKMGIWHLQ